MFVLCVDDQRIHSCLLGNVASPSKCIEHKHSPDATACVSFIDREEPKKQCGHDGVSGQSLAMSFGDDTEIELGGAQRVKASYETELRLIKNPDLGKVPTAILTGLASKIPIECLDSTREGLPIVMRRELVDSKPPAMFGQRRSPKPSNLPPTGRHPGFVAMRRRSIRQRRCCAQRTRARACAVR